MAQWIVKPIIKTSPKRNTATRSISAARTQDTTFLTPLSLPFFDDFTSSDKPYVPDSKRWYYRETVELNFGSAINPPSLGVVSFNGIDSLGGPYDATNALAKGYGDHLDSWPINLAAVPPDQRDSVYLSIFFQFQGNGDAPDPGDHLDIDFKTDSSEWIAVSQIDSALQSDTFTAVSVKVADPRFFHDQFQFRIRSFGRISGPWDNWNVDYVYLNMHRYANDVSFPDRSITTPLTSLFGKYWSIPAEHFHSNADTAAAAFAHPIFRVTNLRQDQQPGQPIKYYSNVKIDEWKEGVPVSSKTVPLDNAFPANLVAPNEHKDITLNTIPMVSDFTVDSDSIRVVLETILDSQDNFVDKVPPIDSSDYLPKFTPIDFRVNDVTRSTHILSSYYAYDDGTAEFAAGLNQAGTEVAYRYDLKTNEVVNMRGIDMYFPNIGDQSTQTLILTLRSDTTDSGLIYSELISLKRSVRDSFIHHPFFRNVLVQGHVYVGWKQTASTLTAVGLDTSHDTTDKIYFNVNGTWESGPDLQGSLMLRPVFGERRDIATGIEDEPVLLDVYPNPTSGSFYLSQKPDAIQMMDFTGRPVEFTNEFTYDHSMVSLKNPQLGIYLLKARVSGKTVTRRVMVQPRPGQ